MVETSLALNSLRIQRSKTILFPLLGLGLALSVSAALAGMYLLLAVGLVEFFVDRKKVSLPDRTLFFLILAYILWGVLSSLINGSAGLRKSFSSQSAFLLIFMMVWLGEKKDLKNLVIFFAAGCVVQGVWSVLQQASGINSFPTTGSLSVPAFFSGWPEGILREMALRNGRAVGSRSHPLTLAEGLVPAFFILWIGLKKAFETHTWKSRKGVWMAAGFLFVSAGLLLAQGRGVWLGLLLGCAVAAVPFRGKTKLLLFLGLAAAFTAGMSFSPHLRSRFFSAFTSTGVAKSDAESKSIRLGLWEKAWAQGWEKPVMGQGLRGVHLQLDEAEFSDRRVWREAHNMYLQAFAERGAPGFFLFLAILFFCGRLLYHLPTDYKWPFLGIYCALLFAGITESWMKDKEVAMIFWTFMGVAAWIRLRGDTVETPV